MDGLHAFVGHSFTADDEPVVASFLKYFDSLSRSNLNFRWTHAEAAEPKALARKVSSLLSECNLFIAICTRKEHVIAPGALRRLILPRGYLKADAREFRWKTSDWIIQEIGLAIGKELNLILLLEKGVESPGGLQGDIEYIPFDRMYPAQSFQKLFEMISAISPRSIGAITKSSTDTTAPPTEDAGDKAEAATPMDENWWKPQPGWSWRMYQIAFIHLMQDGEEDKAKEISDAYVQTEQAGDADNRVSWDAFVEFTRLRLARGGSLAKLKELAESHPESPGTLEQLGKGLAEYNDHADAGATYERAATRARDKKQALQLLGRAAVEYARAEAQAPMSAAVKEMKSMADAVADGEVQLLSVLRLISEITKRKDAMIATLERLLELQPDNESARFSLAHLHAQEDHNTVALFHYLRIREQERGAAAWNNLGVAFEGEGLPARAVSAYRVSEELGETLAMSNLAQKFISSGFLAEAQAQCERALQIPDFHQNVASTMADLKAVPEEEEKRQVRAVERAKTTSNFYRMFGHALTRPEPSDIARHWKSPECNLSARLTGGELELTGSYETSGFGLGLAGLFGATTQSTPDRYRVTYKGSFRGRAIEGVMGRTLEEDPTKVRGVLSTQEYKSKVLMLLSDSGEEIHVMEKPEKSAPRFQILTKKSDREA